MTQASHTGHCRCGTISMLANAEPEISVLCHCDDCRRAIGAPVLASVGFLKSGVKWTGNPSRHTLGTATRLFCRECGSPVAQEHESQPTISFINTGFMDNPEAYPPTMHTFAGQQLGWLNLHDDLPRVEKTVLIETN